MYAIPAFEFPLILLFVIFTSAITEITDKIRLSSFFVVSFLLLLLSSSLRVPHMFYYYFIICSLFLLPGIAFLFAFASVSVSGFCFALFCSVLSLPWTLIVGSTLRSPFVSSAYLSVCKCM